MTVDQINALTQEELAYALKYANERDRLKRLQFLGDVRLAVNGSSEAYTEKLNELIEWA